MYDWSCDKDAILRKERGIGFQDIVHHIDKGHVVEISKHPNQKKYPRQRIMYLLIDEYVYMVPFVKDDKSLFLKTIIPSRKHTKTYLKRKQADGI